jgi:predicted regulator of Ras-like GTPase activity (Roadblock/LC7/MglB family)
MTVETNTGQLDWLLNELVQRLAGSERAVLLSADGLLIGRSHNFSVDNAEHLAAMCSGFQSLARGAGRQFGGGQVRQTVVEMEHSFLVVTAAGRGACLALLAGAEADMGMVAYEMNLMVKRVGSAMKSEPRGAGTSAGVDQGP